MLDVTRSVNVVDSSSRRGGSAAAAAAAAVVVAQLVQRAGGAVVSIGTMLLPVCSSTPLCTGGTRNHAVLQFAMSHLHAMHTGCIV